MKNTLIVLALFMVACSKNNDVQIQPTQQEKNVCNFGITEFNQVKRPFNGLDLLAKGKGGNSGKGNSGTTTTTTTTTTSTNSGSSVILLDFDGVTVTGTSWNYNSLSINCAYSGLSQTEINTVVSNITADYSPFNVIVTTDENVYNAANPYKRTRVIFTESYEWYGMTGGVAYNGSFTWGNNTPCFVFSSLLNYNVHNISVAASHEAGHTLGLSHQATYDNCVKTSEYNYGSNGSAPIMGVAYYVPTGSWWVGPTPISCSNIQDDKAVLTGLLGAK